MALGDLTSVFPRELVDAVLGKSQPREVRQRLLPPRLMVYAIGDHMPNHCSAP
ncbi:transposase domain-containing protein [Streptomyces sp. NPDC020192]|uniref:transposase domain-containing protein n=1 Tax=Streptomyces sp. NPDC020192 TaxID=3365066 RepID=UPI003792DAE1